VTKLRPETVVADFADETRGAAKRGDARDGIAGEPPDVMTAAPIAA
jgi:hypothetical protein